MTDLDVDDLPQMPYPGLRSFRNEESYLFFGRDSCVNQMIDRLAEERFLAVIGASGIGKSSLVKTGLIDGLYLGLLAKGGVNWRIADFRPAGNPMRSLALALLRVAEPGTEPNDAGIDAMVEFLRRGPRAIVEWCLGGALPPRTSLLILADQFEELFSYNNYSGQQEAESFAALLIETARAASVPVYVTLTMRPEYLGSCALIPDLSEQINAGIYLARRMTRDEMREAIVGPAAACGFEIEPALVNRLLNDLMKFAPWEGETGTDRLQLLARRADQLPLMQHMMNRLWQQAQAASPAHILLTEHAYEALGGLENALSSHADEIYARLGDDQPVTEKIFRALVDGSSVAAATRRPCRLDELVALAGGDRAAALRVVDAYRADSLLMASSPMLEDDTIVDISHEALIRQWKKLSVWLLDEAKSGERYAEYARQSASWRAYEQKLLTGRPLQDAIAWQARQRPNLAWARRYSPGENAAEPYQRTIDYIRLSAARWRFTRRATRIGAALVVLGVFIGGLRGFELYAKNAGDAAEKTSHAVGQTAMAATQKDYLAAFHWYKMSAWFGYAPADLAIGDLYYYGHGVPQSYLLAIKYYQLAGPVGHGEAENNIGYLYDLGLGVPKDSKQALKWYLKAAAQGDSAAEYNVGSDYNTGAPMPRDYRQAMVWYRKSAGQHNGDAEQSIGDLYRYGKDIKVSFTDAESWYESAAQDGSAIAELDLGFMYEAGELPGGANYEEALNWYKRAVADGNAQANKNIGVLYENGDLGAQPDYLQAMNYFKAAYLAGYLPAATDIGHLYGNGWGVTLDYAQALAWYLKGAAAGDDRAYEYLGESFRDSLGVPQNYVQAMQWFQKASAEGNTDAQAAIGGLYDAGEGVPVDKRRALAWYRKAAAANNTIGENNIGNDYYNGSPVPQDYNQAMVWYQKAASGHDADAEESIGDLYFYGHGVKQNESEAERWYNIAASDGSGEAEYLLAKIYSNRADAFDSLRMLTAAAGDHQPDAEMEIANQGVSDHNDAQARYWYERAAADGSTDAAQKLGLMDLNAPNGASDDTAALKWFAQVDGDAAAAETDIAQRYQNGNGVPSNAARALIWYKRAIADGSEDAADDAAALYLGGSHSAPDPQAAVAMFRTALKFAQTRLAAHPDDTNDANDVVWHLILTGQPKPALVLLAKALQRAPGNYFLLSNEADALMMLGNDKAARKIYLDHRDVKEMGEGNGAWTKNINGDFATLRRLGYSFPLMTEITRDFRSGN